jgi:hypothetical protein
LHLIHIEEAEERDRYRRTDTQTETETETETEAETETETKRERERDERGTSLSVHMTESSFLDNRMVLKTKHQETCLLNIKTF